MRVKLTALASSPPHLWTIWLPGVLVPTFAALFIFVNFVGLIMGSWDTPMPGLHWLWAGVIGQCGLGSAGVVLLLVGITHPGWRLGAAVTAWMILASEVGWFWLTNALSLR